MANEQAHEHGELVVKLMAGKATQGEAARVGAHYKQWVRQEWEGNEDRAAAFCVEALSTAFGGGRGEWGTLTTEEGTALLQFFMLVYLPTRSSRDDDARSLRDVVRNNGMTLRHYAQKIM
ncbi:hypothetical protein GR925_36030 [Streptomyces sp. HUCO-GS316]|uniref:hypothetical protein n=1 Tax=Streptomyces sp. HUCO-GS316 TaxID=2692198 RepID=UPI0013715492|nr:hypothetical protein [Streptomyces sp. HUCO-GS316]MXM68679.1 hypothetical protein [Streptomyces sp. HUCO-GS316]